MFNVAAALGIFSRYLTHGRGNFPQGSAPIGAWKCNFSAFLGNYDGPTNQQTDIGIIKEDSLNK